MKRFIIFGIILLVNLSLTVVFYCTYRDTQKIKQRLVKFSEKQAKLASLEQENRVLVFPWELYRNDTQKEIHEKFRTVLQQADFLQKDFEIYRTPLEDTKNIKRPQLSYESGFFSGFLLHNDCLDFLKLLVQFDGPIWIHSLTLQRNHTDNYGFQISVIYTLASLK